MSNQPGTGQAAFMALELVEELVRQLDKRGLIKAEEIYQAAIGVLDHDTAQLRKEGAALLRKRLTDRA